MSRRDAAIVEDLPPDAIINRRVRIPAKNTNPRPMRSQRVKVPVRNQTPALVRKASNIAAMPVDSAMPDLSCS